MCKIRLLLIITLFINTLAFAEKLPFSLPSEFMTKHGPLAPLCLLHFTGEQNNIKSINIASDKCIEHKQSYNSDAMKRGFIGYNIKSKEPSMRPPAVFYRYIGKQEESTRYIFEVNWSGGGSGFFSALLALKLKNNHLSLAEYIDGGDRCLGGIHDAKLINKQLVYKKQMTPQMVLDVNQNTLSESALLQDCAICCIGDVLVKGNKVQGIQFNGNIVETDKKDGPQGCFNQLIQTYGAEHKTFLDIRQLELLQTQIHSKCKITHLET